MQQVTGQAALAQLQEGRTPSVKVQSKFKTQDQGRRFAAWTCKGYSHAPSKLKAGPLEWTPMCSCRLTDTPSKLQAGPLEWTPMCSCRGTGKVGQGLWRSRWRAASDSQSSSV